MSDFLEQVVSERRAYAETARERRSERSLLEGARENLAARKSRELMPADAHVHGDEFTRALQMAKRDGRMAVIAEVKRQSPALGSLAPDVDPALQARSYVAGGATAISVLTEPRHWGGSLRDLERVREAVHVPILCKDVIVSEYQIAEARSAGADAVLLIAEALGDAELRRFLERAADLNMGALVEAHEPLAFGRAVATRAAVIGANARDLRHPKEIDTTRARELHAFVGEDQVFVAESGIASVDDARALPSRVDAVLIGTALMRAQDPTPLIRGIASITRTRRESLELTERTR